MSLCDPAHGDEDAGTQARDRETLQDDDATLHVQLCCTPYASTASSGKLLYHPATVPSGYCMLCCMYRQAIVPSGYYCLVRLPHPTRTRTSLGASRPQARPSCSNNILAESIGRCAECPGRARERYNPVLQALGVLASPSEGCRGLSLV